MKLQRIQHLRLYTIIVIVMLVVGGLVYTHRRTLIQNPLVSRIVPMFHSIRKLPDIFYSWTLFTKTNLPVYSLHLTNWDLKVLTEALPKDPFGSTSLNTVERTSSKATFTSGDYSDRVEVRYRGSLSNNWNSQKKSYLIKFPDNHIFESLNEVSLYLPEDRLYAAEPLDSYRARKLGLLSPDIFMARLDINGKNNGVYTVMERWTQDWLERTPDVSPHSNIIGLRQLPELGGAVGWKSWNQASTTQSAVLLELVDHATNAEFEKYAPYILDLDAFYKRDVINILSGGYHNDSYYSTEYTADPGDSNTILLFDAVTGKFRPIPYNTAIYPNPGLIQEMPSYLTQRMWSIPAFRKERDKVLAAYLTPENLKDDLVFVQKWNDTYKHEFYADPVKLDPNYKVSRDMDAIYGIVENNFKLASEELKRAYDFTITPRKTLSLPKDFLPVLKAAATPQQFVAEHSAFALREGGLKLYSGSYIFDQNIIVPGGTRLTIDPGVHIYMAAGASFISYSPVTALGTEYNPISVQSVDAKPWGSFAVIDARSATSTFAYVNFKNGKDAVINDIPIHAMLAIHHSDVNVSKSSFSDGKGDDAFDVKEGIVVITDSVFTNNTNDSIDLESGHKGTIIKNNIIVNNPVTKKKEADGIDLSWTQGEITGNKIFGCVDKGISLGETSQVVVKDNIIALCAIGIAVKDNSVAVVENNIFAKNGVGIDAYNGKQVFGGGTIIARKNFFVDNKDKTSKDKRSTIEQQDNVDVSAQDLKKYISAEDYRQIYSR